MMRFLASLVSALLAVVTIGAVVVAATGGTGVDGGVASGTVSAQAEDEAPDEAEAGDATTDVNAGLSPLERLLMQLTPPAEGAALPSAQRVVLSRDPFRPVVPVSTDGGGTDGGGTDGGGTDGGGTDGGGTDGGGTDGGGTDGGGTDGGGTDGGGTDEDVCSGDEEETVCEGIVVTLDGFTDDGLAIVTIDGTSFTVGVDDEFATSFRVLAINEPCVTLLFGDETFSVCTGTTVLK